MLASTTESSNSGVVVSRHEGPAAVWDEFVRAQAHWTHFHLHGWRTVMERVFGHDCVYLIARDAATNQVIGTLPLVRVRSLIFGHFLVSMPFVNYGGPLGTASAVRALADQAARIAAATRAKTLELRSRVDLPLDLPVSHRKLTVVLDMPSEPSALLASFPAKLRSQIKRPAKEGVVMRTGLEEIEPFYAVFAHHMRDLGTPVLPRRFFETLAEVFPNDVAFAVAYHQGRPVACGAGFLWNSEFEITWASALRSHKALSPNMLVYWHLMEQTIARGARRFNFGRCTRDSGTHKFKMQWGGQEEPLWWYHNASASTKPRDSATPSPDQGIFAMATRVWQRLPLPIATRLGPRIVRFIP
jgi:FemAB-related protein (PEP-CTERM system-associated)